MLYVVHVMAGTENETKAMLSEHLDSSLCHEIFIPKYVSKRRYKGVWHDVLRSLFPGYVFLEASDPVKIFARIMQIPKGMQMVHADTEILSVFPEEEKFLRNLMDEDYIVQMSAGFTIGEELYITKGALKHYRGKIQRIDRHKRIAILGVELFGRETPVEVGLEVVKKVSRVDFFQWREKEQKMRQGKDSRSFGKKSNGQIQEDVSDERFVYIKSGIFEGISASVLKEEGDFLEVSVLMLGQKIPVQVKKEDVEEIF